jgi:hypothetical protein
MVGPILEFIKHFYQTLNCIGITVFKLFLQVLDLPALIGVSLLKVVNTAVESRIFVSKVLMNPIKLASDHLHIRIDTSASLILDSAVHTNSASIPNYQH